MLLHVAGEERPLRAGGVALIPRDTPHALLVTSETCRLLAFCSPDVERFFRAASVAATAGGKVDFERVKAAGIETGAMQMVGPPPFQR